MSSFKKFHDRKVDEVLNARQSFDQARMMGSFPHSSRQPAAFHYFLTMLELHTPDTSKSEILFEAVRSAFEEVVSPSITDSEQPDVYSMLFMAYVAKCAKSSADSSSDSVISISDDSKRIAEEFISDFDSRTIPFPELFEKYSGTFLASQNLKGE